MQELSSQSKALFWAAVLALLALTMVPSLALIETSKQYLGFLLQWNPGTIPATRTSRVPHREGLPPRNPEPQIRFVQFGLDAPKSAQVLIAGDFNGWQPEAMFRSSEGKGRWEILLPLPPGRYQYAFQVNGAWTLDPASKTFGQKGDLKTSIRQVP